MKPLLSLSFPPAYNRVFSISPPPKNQGFWYVGGLFRLQERSGILHGKFEGSCTTCSRRQCHYRKSEKAKGEGEGLVNAGCGGPESIDREDTLRTRVTTGSWDIQFESIYRTRHFPCFFFGAGGSRAATMAWGGGC